MSTRLLWSTNRGKWGGEYNLVVGVVNEYAEEHLPVDGVVPAGPGFDLHHLLERGTMSELAPL